jgi:hypothetical protein
MMKLGESLGGERAHVCARIIQRAYQGGASSVISKLAQGFGGFPSDAHVGMRQDIAQPLNGGTIADVPQGFHGAFQDVWITAAGDQGEQWLHSSTLS